MKPWIMRCLLVSLGVLLAGGCDDGDEPCTQCPDGCYFLDWDPDHCGSCTNVCSAGQVCSGGVCTSSSGSCPFAFLWDGAGYRYYTDLSGSPLGAGLSFFKPQHYGVNVYELGDWAADQGRFSMRLRELTFEASYFDQAMLVLVDVPEGYGVFNEWSSTPQLDREPSRAYVTVRLPLRPPVSAVTEDGADALDALRAADGVPLPVQADGLSRVLLDFGALEHPEHARLIVTTWGAYADYRDAQTEPPSAGTLVETLDAEGRWQTRVLAGKSASDAKTWSFDVSGVLATGDTRMRITMAHQPSTVDLLDAVYLDDSEQVPFTVTRVPPLAASLAFGGGSPVAAPTVTQRARVESVSIAPPAEAFLNGAYTRYGDVRPLLLAADDRFAIMAYGDELALEFEAPPQEPGTTRRVFLEADVFYTLKFHPFGQLTDTIEPLPFHGMQTYPYAPELWPYRDDPTYAEYLREWNTRVIVVASD
jgi:hypothetical protein